MSEKCSYCGGEFENTKALGSHIHYMHSNINAKEGRSERDEERFRRLLDSCISEKDLPRTREIEKVEQAISEIPLGVSPDLDQYRDAFKCALGKEKLMKEVEKLMQESKTEGTK